MRRTESHGAGEAGGSRLRRWFGADKADGVGRHALARASRIVALESGYASLSDDALGSALLDLRGRALSDEPLTELIETVLGIVREASTRRLGLRPYPVQLAAGLAMAEGGLAEMMTGEGKTLAAVPVAVLLALRKDGVHVLTFNDYLARRDADWMGPIYKMLGISVGVVTEGMSLEKRRAAYLCDVTYLTAREAGFDYLRDGLALSASERVQRGLSAAIVDEADSILIDEARVPLVIAGSIDVDAVDPTRISRVVADLVEGRDFDSDAERRNAHLTDAGLSRVEIALEIRDLYAPGNATLVAEIQNALHARVLLRPDVDYIVRDGRVELVDELTGRTVEDRLWPDGLQAAIEAKEGVALRPEGRVLGSITLQHFAREYGHLCGMTATASSAADELKAFYGLSVIKIPTHRPCVRVDHTDRVFVGETAKCEGVLNEILAVHAEGRPILVGTSSVAESERLAGVLAERGVPCAVLNARNDEAEARVIAQAGRLGAVTISTNMAGRGTDIRLGGADGAQRDAVSALGGLHVIGTARHESRRIDDQLRGRAGRQGDPGSSRFFLSLEDDLFQRFGDGTFVTRALRGGDGATLPERMVHREVARAQRVVEGQNLDVRRTLHDYAVLLNRQRASIQGWRESLLDAGTPTSLFERADPGRYRALCDEAGSDAVVEIERQVTLRIIDRAYSDHLGRMEEVRDAIHLSRAAGRGPLDEFHRRAGDAFEALIQDIEDRVAAALETIRVIDGGLVYETRGLERPTSTWTYTVGDDPFQLNPLANMAGSIGLASGMAVLWPLLLAWGAWQRRRRRARRKRGESLSR